MLTLATALLGIEMTVKKRKAWLDNIIYLSAGFLAVALCMVFVLLKINYFPQMEFPTKAMGGGVVSLLLGGYLLRHFKKKWTRINFWALFLPLMTLHIVLMIILVRANMPLLIFWIVVVTEFPIIATIIHRFTENKIS